MSLPGWSMDLHIRPTINTSSQQLSKSLTWSNRLSSIKPLRGGKGGACHYIVNIRLTTQLFLEQKSVTFESIESFQNQNFECLASLNAIFKTRGTMNFSRLAALNLLISQGFGHRASSSRRGDMHTETQGSRWRRGWQGSEQRGKGDLHFHLQHSAVVLNISGSR